MTGFFEHLLGLKGFLSDNAEYSLHFNPKWPLPTIIGTSVWNALLVAAAIVIVVLVYRREGRSRAARIALASLRAVLLLFVIVLLNRPVIDKMRTRTEPSEVAILVDDTVSMSVKDVLPQGSAVNETRLEAIVKLLDGDKQQLLRDLAKTHTLRLYRFDRQSRPLIEQATTQPTAAPQAGEGVGQVDSAMIKAVSDLKINSAGGQETQLIPSLISVLDELQGQRLAGVVLLTDGRETPTQSASQAFDALRGYGIKVYPVPVGSPIAPKNVQMLSFSMQDTAFVNDLVSVHVRIDGTGYEDGHVVVVDLVNNKTHAKLLKADGSPATANVTLHGSDPVDQEIFFKPTEEGELDVRAIAEPGPDELTDTDNYLNSHIDVLKAQINLLYVAGYPRWDYRYVKNTMLRDKTINISCWLTSADAGFPQEGDPAVPADGPDKGKEFPGPITRFPVNMDEMLKYDVVIFGDVDRRQFSDPQMQLVREFVSKYGGGFGMVAGPRYAPSGYKGTPIDDILPVNISRTSPETPSADSDVTTGFRPAVTKAGLASNVFRFLPDSKENLAFLLYNMPDSADAPTSWQPLFWYCHGIVTKPTSIVWAESRTDNDPTNEHKAPLLVAGRYGAGRTLFSAMDDSWRWRYYTNGSVFDTYWIEQVRYLAGGRKLGQRHYTFAPSRQTYVLGEQVQFNLHIIDPVLLQQLPAQISVQVLDEDKSPVRDVVLQKNGDQYSGSFTADRLGSFAATLKTDEKLLKVVAPLPFRVFMPLAELKDARIDKNLLERIADQTHGQLVPLADAQEQLPKLIHSAARTVPEESSQPLWDAPLAMIVFVLLLTTEWVLRKVFGML